MLFRITPTNTAQSITKRHILSEIAKSFGPLGLQAPVGVTAKLLMRQLWRSWDEQLPEDVIQVWNRFREGLRTLSELKIERISVVR